MQQRSPQRLVCSLQLPLPLMNLLLLQPLLPQLPAATPLTSAALGLHGPHEPRARKPRRAARGSCCPPFVPLERTARLPLPLRSLPSDAEGRRKGDEGKGVTHWLIRGRA